MKNAKTAHSIGKNRRLSSSRRSLLPLLVQRLLGGLRFSIGYSFRPFSVILCLLSAAFLFSCSQPSPVREQLSRAEQVMETDSRAAAAVLDSIDASTLRGEDAALYALLKTQADYKSRIRLTSDSLPLIATHYYGTRRKTERAALSQYYLGCAYGDMHRDLDAIDALLRATTLFPDTTNKYFAYSLFELGNLYMNHHMEDAAIEQFKRYRHSEVCKTDSLNIGYADYFLGRTYLNNSNYDLADSLFHRVLNNSKSNNINKSDSYFQLAKLHYYIRHDTQTALDYINQYKSKRKGGGALHLLEAEILADSQRPAQAYESYIDALENSNDIHTRCVAYKGMAQTAPLIGLADSVQPYLNRYSALLDSIYFFNRQKEIADIQESHVIELHDKELKARKSHLQWIYGTSAFAIVLITTILFLLSDRRRKTNFLRLQDELRRANVETLRLQSEEKEQSTDLVSLYLKKLQTCEKLFWRSSSADKLLTSPDLLSKEQKNTLRTELFYSFVDIIMDIRDSSSKKIGDDEILFCILSFLNYPSSYMVSFLNTTSSTLRTRKARLREKMPESLFGLFFS